MRACAAACSPPPEARRVSSSPLAPRRRSHTPKTLSWLLPMLAWSGYEVVTLSEALDAFNLGGGLTAEALAEHEQRQRRAAGRGAKAPGGAVAVAASAAAGPGARAGSGRPGGSAAGSGASGDLVSCGYTTVHTQVQP